MLANEKNVDTCAAPHPAQEGTHVAPNCTKGPLHTGQPGEHGHAQRSQGQSDVREARTGQHM